MGESYLHSNAELSGQKSARNDERDNDTNLPPPILHTVLIWHWVIILLGGVLRILDEDTFDRISDVSPRVEKVHEQVTAGHANLEEGEHEHHHDTRPKKPVTRRRTVDDLVIVFERYGVVVYVLELRVRQGTQVAEDTHAHPGHYLGRSVCLLQGRF